MIRHQIDIMALEFFRNEHKLPNSLYMVGKEAVLSQTVSVYD